MPHGNEPIRVFWASACRRIETSNERPTQVGMLSNFGFDQKPHESLVRNHIVTTILAASAVLFFYAGAFAQSVSGRFMTTFYSYHNMIRLILPR